MLRIGTHNNMPALRYAALTQAELSLIGVDSELVNVPLHEENVQNEHLHTGARPESLKTELENLLLCGEVDLIVYPMEALSTTLPEGLVITAVSGREYPADLLVIRPEAYDPTQILRIKKGAVIGVSTERRKAQMQDIRPDIEWRNLPDSAAIHLQSLREGHFDADFLAASEVHRLDLDLRGLEIVELNPREFVPAPAQGVLAWLTNREDVPTRRILKKIHHPEVSACTNVERRVLQLLGGDCTLPLGVYCERDAAGNFHAIAAGFFDRELRRAQVSQSTTIGLAEALFKRLQ